MSRCLGWSALIVVAFSFNGCGSAPPASNIGPESCTNRVDDNGDGKIDCADPKCLDYASCLTGSGGGSANTGGGGGNTGGGSVATGGGSASTGGGGASTGGGVSGTGGGSSATGGGNAGTGGGTGNTGGGSASTGGGDASTGGGSGATGGGDAGTGGGSGATGGGDASAGGGTATGGGDASTGGGGGAMPSYGWMTGAWSSCSNGCGSGTQSRTVICERDDGATVSDTFCMGSKPAESQICTDASGCGTCALPWGASITSGSSVTAYAESSPLGSCTSETRTCLNGVLSGSYTARTCAAGCTLPWGGQMASGATVQAYYVRFGTLSQPCEHPSTVQTRTCTNGTLGGSYPWQGCVNYPCVDEGASFMEQSVNFPSSTLTVHAAARVCNGASATFSPAIFTGPDTGACLWGSRWHEQSTCGYYQGVAYRCWGGNWSVAGSGVNGCPQAL